MSTRVILVRHGESSYNAERRVQGHCDLSSLTDKGEAMATQVATALQELTFDAVYSSPLQRAKRTAEIILSGLTTPPPLQTTDDLKEISLPLWEGLPFTEVEAKYPDEFQDWKDQPHKLKMTLPDGTEFFPIAALFEQARRFWQTLLSDHAGQSILVVAHSGINRSLIYSAISLQPEHYHRFQISNCGISILNFAGELGQPVQIESLNMTSHLGEALPNLRPKHQGPRLLLVRHGETEWNRQGRFQGQIDVPLNDNGRHQAEQAGEFLKSVPIDYAVTSSMSRPRETAEIILKHHPGVPLALREDLREISHGLWEGKFEAEIEQSYPGLLHQWQLHPETVQMPEGENLQQVWERAIAGWNAIVQAYSGQPCTVMVVAHDAINKAILCHVSGLGAESFWNFKQGNGAVSVIDYPTGETSAPMLMSMNITTHLGSVLDKTAAGAL
ncbi:histidine phosphatase family protein [Myxacorys almedinensis]|uniref:Histidine phosphatase family protein n=1 Tax=Myxacorys almedinensis A TaxID=2690445 RepID=A0A8J7Z3B7_9CYAN|nr:histidine phosphatase family protein [Myxacorys almedinensis]NDJ19632.1 histidine phosphatase family protein [Myxacorys almedinensis A]